MQANKNISCFTKDVAFCGLGSSVQQVWRFSWDYVTRNVKGQHSKMGVLSRDWNENDREVRRQDNQRDFQAIGNAEATTKDGLFTVKNKENKETKLEPSPNLDNEKVDKSDNVMEGIKLDGGTETETQDIQNSKVVGMNGKEKRKMDRTDYYPFYKATDEQIDRSLGGRMVKLSQVLMQDHGQIRLGHTKPVDMVPLGCNQLQSLEEIRLGHTEPVYEYGDLYHIPNPEGTVPITIVDGGGDNIQEDRRNPSDEIRNYMGIMKYHEENIAEKLKST